VIFSSQNIDVAESICDKLLVLDRGKKGFFGTFEELDTFTKTFELEIEVLGSEELFLARLQLIEPINISKIRKKPLSNFVQAEFELPRPVL